MDMHNLQDNPPDALADEILGEKKEAGLYQVLRVVLQTILFQAVGISRKTVLMSC
jgi:hypothetical protein